VRLRAYWGVWKTLGVCLVGDALRDRNGFGASLGVRTLAYLLSLAALMSLLQSGEWLLSFGSTYGAWPAVKAGGLLLPSTFVVSLPVSFFMAVALFRTTKGARFPSLIPATAATALACASILFAAVMFAVPNVNQSYRTLVFDTIQPPAPDGRPRELSKGLAEMNWMELNAHIRQAPSSRQEELARAHRLQRFALIMSPLVMALLGLGVAGRWRSRAATIGVSLALLIVYAGCFTLASGANDGGTRSAYGTWTANAAFAIVGLRLLRTRPEWRDETTLPAGAS
jgi:lipopolysaccharide export LptBFGC system permease protein LptF